MLRISSTAEAGSRVTVKAEGSLVGDWVPLLHAECVRHLDAARLVELDLADVRFVDRDGAAMVRGLMARGVKVIRASALMNALLGPSGTS